MEIKFHCGGWYTLLPSIRLSTRSAGGKPAGPRPPALEDCPLPNTRFAMVSFILPFKPRVMLQSYLSHRILGYCNLFNDSIHSPCMSVYTPRCTCEGQRTASGAALSPSNRVPRMGTGVIRLGYTVPLPAETFHCPKMLCFEGGKEKLFKFRFQ